ncbi:MAG: nickel pincer cofactor biosynthesis protein LarB [Methanomassiliicoccales archaeon]|nr:nickel pincer cofactor biosynthesis protein LarB [Methanomassiliicoccales archaeon]
MKVREVLERYKKGGIDAKEAERILKLDFLERIGNHTVFDHAREARRGIPEIILGNTKTPEDVVDIVRHVLEDRELVIVSRASPLHYKAIKKGIGAKGVKWVEKACMVVVDRRIIVKVTGRIGILTAGTSDISVAEEAKVVAEAMGCEVITAFDVGIAAFHRFMDPLACMLEKECDALIVVAGMEGALPSVISSLADVPVIGVPTSVGYGMGGEGTAALLSMLQTCSPGLVVVNIDNGVGAGATAALISRRCRATKKDGRRT